MTDKEFKDSMEKVFNNIESAQHYYWQYKYDLEYFKLINSLAYECGRINSITYHRTKDFIEREYKRYAR